MPATSRSSLFNVPSFSSYVRWDTFNRSAIPIDAVAVGTSSKGEKVLIGRVQRNGHTIPGSIVDGVCRFRFDGEWLTETERIEVLRDKFGLADKALVWQADQGRKDSITRLPLWSLVGGVQPSATQRQSEDDEETGQYLVARLRGTTDIVPVLIRSEDRHFDEGYIAYKGDAKDLELLVSEYHRHVAICPGAPLPPKSGFPTKQKPNS